MGKGKDKKRTPPLRRRKDFEITFYEGVVKKAPNYVGALTSLAEAYTRRGFYEEGLEIDRRLSSLCQDDPVVHYNLACSFALVGQTKEALLSLRRAIALGYRHFEYLLKDPDLRSLHGQPEFQRLLQKGRPFHHPPV